MATWENLGITSEIPYGSWSQTTAQNYVERFSPYLYGITRFPKIRMSTAYGSTASRTATRLWAQLIKSYKPNQVILYGAALGGTSLNLAAYYSLYEAYMLEEAVWAQANGIDRFSVGNEFAISGQNGTISITSLIRSSNVTTAISSVPHGLQSGDTYTIAGATPSDFNMSEQAVTVTGESTFTYANTGTDGSATGSITGKCGEATLVRLEKLLGVSAAAVFDGPISISISQGHEAAWIAEADRGPFDYIAYNAYGSNSLATFKANVDAFFAVYGTNLIITEFAQHNVWASSRAKGFAPNQKEFDLAYADEIYEKLTYLRGLNLPEVYFFTSWGYQWGIFYASDGEIGSGNYKSVADRILDNRISTHFFGSQLT